CGQGKARGCEESGVSEVRGPRRAEEGRCREETAGQEGSCAEGETMIRLVTLGEFPEEVLDHVARRLNAAYGIDCEIEGEAELPDGALSDDQTTYDAVKLLDEIEDETQLFADDKVVYLTTAPLATAEGPMGKGPVTGYPQ